jgi:hypothetical protein
VSELLRRLTRKNEKFVWGEEQDRAFVKLKNLLANACKLGYFDPNMNTKGIADASPVGLGAALVQGEGNKLSVISYASTSLTDVERRYSQTKRKPLPWYGLVKGSICTCMDSILNC